MRHVLDIDVFFAAIYGTHVLHPVARRWLDKAKPAGWGIAVRPQPPRPSCSAR